MSRSRTRTAVALVGVVALVAGLIGTAALIATSDDEPTAPTVDSSPPLSLSRTTNVGTEATGVGVGGEWRTSEPLADATTEGVVIDPGASTATEAQVRSLVAALGMTTSSLEPVDGGWTARGRAGGERAAFALDERAGNVWQFGRGPLADCLSVVPGADPDTATSCAAGEKQPDPDEAGPGRAALLRTAAELYELLGVTPATGLRANDASGVTYLDVPLSIEGLPVVDVTLSVGADEKGVVSGSGWYSPTFAPVGRYPLVSQQEAFAQLRDAPVPEIAPSCPPEGCPDPEPREVTAARLAWLTSRNGEQPVLVPAWQFEVDGLFGPAVVAVDPQYLDGTP